MNIHIVFENKYFLVIDKPAGLVVHPGAGNEKDTVVSWFLEKYPEANKLSWPDLTRQGIVHRLDKDTSGLMLVAKNPEVLIQLQELFQAHKINKTYLALVYGKLDQEKGEINGFIGRNPHHRRKQTSQTIFFDFEPGKKREAKTEYKVLKTFLFQKEYLSLVEATLQTGRMHQIRVHFKFIGDPVIGDQIYNIKPSRQISKVLNISHQFLHAYKLSFKFKNMEYNFKSSLPSELDIILHKLGEYDTVKL